MAAAKRQGHPDAQAVREVEAALKRHESAVRSFAFSLTRGRSLDAEDLVQHAFSVLYRKLAAGDDVGNARSFLLQVVRRTAADLQRRRLSEDQLQEWLHDTVSREWESPVEEDVLTKLQADYLLTSLPPVSAEALLLYSTGLSMREIGKLLDISETSVGARLKVARKRLQELARQSIDEIDPESPRSSRRRSAPPLDAYEFVFGLDRVAERLRQTYTETAAQEWLVRPNPLLEEKRPIDLLRAGETRRVQGAIDAVAEGVFL